MPARKPKLAVWKFTSCDGCQLSLLDCEDDLLAIADRFEIAVFLEATRHRARGPYDVSVLEGSVSTPHEVERVRDIRRQSKFLIALGACATAGGIQALRNFRDVRGFLDLVYARPDHIDTLPTSTPMADHVPVDFELRGCPPSGKQIVEVLGAYLAGRKPVVPGHSQCVECKVAGTVCVMVNGGIPCMGPVTQAGCGNLCPSRGRGCYGCFGPMETPNAPSLAAWFGRLGQDSRDILRLFRNYNPETAAFRAESERHG
ncbi:MAG: oxidoreductase [Magnetospirillum sp.]|nr:oxidoreductase [Magnetospirillum sp.]